MIAKLLEIKLVESGIAAGNAFPVAAQVGSTAFPFAIYTPGRIEPVADLSGDIAYYRADFRIDLYSDDYAALQSLVKNVENALKMLQEPFDEDLWIYRCVTTSYDSDGFAKTVTGKIEFVEVSTDAI
mgnify:CR=1 FL=1